MDTLEAIFSRRSVRAFTSDAISDQQMECLVKAGAAAPSGGNAQPRLFLTIRQPRRLASLRAIAPGIIDLPPAVIVLCLDKRRLPSNEANSPSLYYDIGTSLENILLAAHATGLGACPVASFHPKALSILLDLPGDVEPCLLVVIGKPKFIPEAPHKHSLEQIYFQETFKERNAND